MEGNIVLLIALVAMNGVTMIVLVAQLVKRRFLAAPHEVLYRHRLIEGAIYNQTNGIIITDSENKIIIWNGGAEKLLGYKEEKIRGHDLRIIRLVLPEVILKNTPIDTEAMHQLQSMIPVSLTVSESKVENECYYTAVVKSIRERKEMEEVIGRELSLLNEGEEIGCYGSWSWDVATNRVMVTEGFNRIFETDDLVTEVEYLMKRVYHEDRDAVYETLAKAQEQKSDYQLRYRIQTLSGKMVRILCKGKMFLTPNGNIKKIVGTIQKVEDE